MQSIARNHTGTMLAMHLPWRDVGAWAKALEENEFKFVKAPLIIGTTKATGYAPSWAHKPLPACQAFFLCKTKKAIKPIHNAFRKYRANNRGDFRDYWSDMGVISKAEYHKHKVEIRKKVSGVQATSTTHSPFDDFTQFAIIESINNMV